jgi:hypothetical protein
MNKRAVSAVVATVLIILITVAAVTVVWTLIVPMVREGMVFRELEGRVDILTSGGYTFYDEDSGVVSVQVGRGNDEGDLKRVRVVFSFAGNSQGSVVDSPDLGQAKTYVFDTGSNGRPDSVSVYPIFLIEGKEVEGDETSSVLNIASGKYGGDGSSIYYLGRDSSVGASCLDILNSGDSSGDGIYQISPNGLDPFSVYCDMTTDGGGWTRIDYASDLEFKSYFSGGDSWKWLTDDFSLVLSNEQIQAIQSVSSEGKQTYEGNCRGVIHYYYGYSDTYAYSFGFEFLDGSVISGGVQDYSGTDISVISDDCGANDGVVRQTVFEIKDVRVPVVNVHSSDNGNDNEEFGSVLTDNPAWLR